MPNIGEIVEVDEVDYENEVFTYKEADGGILPVLPKADFDDVNNAFSVNEGDMLVVVPGKRGKYYSFEKLYEP